MSTASPSPAPLAPSRLLPALPGLAIVLWACAPAHQAQAEPVCDGSPASVRPASVRPAPGPPLVGFWGLNGHTSPEGFDDLKRRFGLSVFQVACSDPEYAVSTLLPMARAAGVKVTLRLTPDHTAYTTLGSFDLARWKEALDIWAGSGVQAFIEDGTLVGHMLLDDIKNFERRDPDAADLDEMARCSKRLFPGLMTYVRQRASEMPAPRRGRYVYVDAAVNQYQAFEGEVGVYAAHEAADAKALGLGVINGLNIADGGDGSSGQAGYRPGRYAMSAAEILHYGSVLAAVPGCGMFLNWEYDGEERWSDGTVGSTYFDRPELSAALLQLSRQVAAHPPVPLLKPAH